MRRFQVVLFAVFFAALPMMAREVPTISSIDPSAVHVASGEWFVTLTGTHYLPLAGVSVVFSGPAGTYALNPNSATDTSLAVWVPEPVLLTPGYYSVKIQAPGTADSNSVTFRVIGNSVFLKVPLIVLAEATSLQGAIAKFDVSATSEFGQNTYIDCSHRSGEQFPFDTTTVDCVATDDFGGAAKESFNVQVADTTPPLIQTPVDLSAFGKPEGTNVLYDVKVSDVVDPDVRADCLPESGSFFRIGTSSVTCTSTDRFKNTATTTFRIHVGTDEMPVLIVPTSVSAEAASREGAVVAYDVTATDSRGGRVDFKCDPGSGSLFPIGLTSVKCTAWGATGQAATEFFDLTVADHAGPVLSLPRDFTEQAPTIDGAYVKYPATATDAVDGDTFVTCFPASGSLFTAGQTTVNCSATDQSRNTSSGTFVVTVLPWFDDTVYATSNPGSPE